MPRVFAQLNMGPLTNPSLNAASGQSAQFADTHAENVLAAAARHLAMQPQTSSYE